MRGKLLGRIALSIVAAVLVAIPMVGWAVAGESTSDQPQPLCSVYLHIHTYPSPIIDGSGVGVETGDYHLHQNCW